MLYQIHVKVNANSFYHQPYRLEIENFVIDVMIDQNRVVEALNIALRVQDYQNFLPKISCDTQSRITQIELRDAALTLRLINLAQHVEAIGSFWCGIRKIYWESPWLTDKTGGEEQNPVI